MKTKGILFKAEMVRAILDGRKTQTRRLVKDAPKYMGVFDYAELLGNPPYPPGQILYVKETWRTYASLDHCKPTGIREIATLEYKADGWLRYPPGPLGMSKKWRTPLFMCPWMSRIWLEVTAVRVERLQEISEEDAIAEGVDPSGPVGHIPTVLEIGRARYQYANLWESINGPGA